MSNIFDYLQFFAKIRHQYNKGDGDDAKLIQPTHFIESIENIYILSFWLIN